MAALSTSPEAYINLSFKTMHISEKGAITIASCIAKSHSMK